jgi:hypothetical protein
MTKDEFNKSTFNLVTLTNPCFKLKNFKVETLKDFKKTVSFEGIIGNQDQYFEYGNQDTKIIHNFTSNIDEDDNENYD